MDKLKIKFPDIPFNNLDEIIEAIRSKAPNFQLARDIFGALKGKSIDDIRDKMKLILKEFLTMIEFIALNVEKVFYLSILVLIKDARTYWINFYKDNTFDNQVTGLIKKIYRFPLDLLRKIVTPLSN